MSGKKEEYSGLHTELDAEMNRIEAIAEFEKDTGEMSQLSKPKEFWTNWMSMHDNLDDAKDNWPKAEWEDLRCYVAYEDYESQRAVIEKLSKELSQMNSRMIDEKAKVDKAVEALKFYAHEGWNGPARKTLAEMGLME